MEVKHMFFSVIITVVLWSPIYYLMIKGKIKNKGPKLLEKYIASGCVAEAVSIKCKKTLPKLVNKKWDTYEDRYAVTYQYFADGIAYKKKCVTTNYTANGTKMILYYDKHNPGKAFTKDEAAGKPGCAIYILMLLQFITLGVIANLIANP